MPGPDCDVLECSGGALSTVCNRQCQNQAFKPFPGKCRDHMGDRCGHMCETDHDLSGRLGRIDDAHAVLATECRECEGNDCESKCGFHIGSSSRMGITLTRVQPSF